MTSAPADSYIAQAQSSGLPRGEALRLAAFALSLPRSWFLAHADEPLSPLQSTALQAVFARRVGGEPVAYIEGQREFYGLDFFVSPAVLIPRPETELLVETAIQLAPTQARVLDLGTGSGAIAIAFAKARPDCTVVACELSAAALHIANRNAALHDAKVAFFQGDWCAALPPNYARFDLIVSNPPYIAVGDAHLHQGDLRFEPAGALTDGADGLQHYRSIARQARDWLSPQGYLIFEHGYDQGQALCTLLHASGYVSIEQHHDADEQAQPRMVIARRAP